MQQGSELIGCTPASPRVCLSASAPFQLMAEEVPTLGGSSTSQVVVSEVQLPAPSVEILAPPLQQGSRSDNQTERKTLALLSCADGSSSHPHSQLPDLCFCFCTPALCSPSS
jgi:hypothetical protein